MRLPYFGVDGINTFFFYRNNEHAFTVYIRHKRVHTQYYYFRIQIMRAIGTCRVFETWQSQVTTSQYLNVKTNRRSLGVSLVSCRVRQTDGRRNHVGEAKLNFVHFLHLIIKIYL